MFVRRFSKIQSPEFPQRLEWLNSEPLRMKKLAGHPVLIEFWTYSCVNCLHVLPYVQTWHNQYSDKGLVVIGVHAPEFAFEKDPENVKAFLRANKLTFPVVLDPDYKLWRLYANRWWPRTFLIDAHGQIVYDHVGEGGYMETEEAIQKALVGHDPNDLPPIKPDLSVGGGICYRTTPETYLGFLRGRFGNDEAVMPKEEQVFTDVGQHEEDLLYLHGHFRIEGECLEHMRALPLPNEYVAIKYSAFSVHAVLEQTKGRAATIWLELDGQPLPEDMAGEDVVFEDGKAKVVIKQSRLYRLVDSDTYHRGTLKIKTADPGVRFYSMTFGGCKGM